MKKLAMKIVNAIINSLKRTNHAGRTEKCVFGGNRRERRVLHRVNAAVGRALSDFSSMRMLATACADERGRNSRKMSSDPIREESRCLIAAAKKCGCFLNIGDVPGTRYTILSGESEVRLDQKARTYYKIKNPFAKSHLKKHSIRYALFEHIIHNVFFPECPLVFLGITEDIREARL